jgi:hypothetical protein
MFPNRKWMASLTVFTLLLAPSNFLLLADLKYEETTRITGGFLEGFSKMAGFFGGKGLNTTTATYLKGDRLRTDNLENGELTSSEIVQLDREEIITIDHKKKTYSVVTFAERRAQMEKALEAMKGQSQKSQGSQPAGPSQDPNVKLEPKIEIKDTGETKVINGFNTRHVILSLQFETEDQKTKDKGAMGTNMDLWLTKDIGSLEERNQFYMKYAEKMAAPAFLKSVTMAPAMTQDPRMMGAMEDLSKRAEALEGEAILTIASFDVSGTPAPGSQPSQASSEPQTSRQGSESSESVGQAIGKALGGFGGFGGFGRKKKKQNAPQPSSAPEQAAPPSGETASANLMSMTTEMKSFSQATLDAALFEVPAGYKLSKK